MKRRATAKAPSPSPRRTLVRPRQARVPEAMRSLPGNADYGLVVDRVGPIRAANFERWWQREGNPVELIAGWVLPMSPGSYPNGTALIRLITLLDPVVRERGW